MLTLDVNHHMVRSILGHEGAKSIRHLVGMGVRPEQLIEDPSGRKLSVWAWAHQSKSPEASQVLWNLCIARHNHRQHPGQDEENANQQEKWKLEVLLEQAIEGAVGSLDLQWSQQRGNSQNLIFSFQSIDQRVLCLGGRSCLPILKNLLRSYLMDDDDAVHAAELCRDLIRAKIMSREDIEDMLNNEAFQKAVQCANPELISLLCETKSKQEKLVETVEKWFLRDLQGGGSALSTKMKKWEKVFEVMAQSHLYMPPNPSMYEALMQAEHGKSLSDDQLSLFRSIMMKRALNDDSKPSFEPGKRRF